MNFNTYDSSRSIDFFRILVFAAILFSGNVSSVTANPVGEWASVASSQHPTHVCRGEVDFNSDTQSLEFAVCLYEEDVRTLLQRRTDSRTDFTNQEKTGPLLEQYLRDNFWVATTDKKELAIDWYGFESDKEGVWLYFEVPINGNPENLVIGNRMLLEIQPGNVSVFRFRWDDKRSNQLFNAQVVGQKLIWAESRKQIEESERNISLSLSETIEANLKRSKAVVPLFDAPPVPRAGN